MCVCVLILSIISNLNPPRPPRQPASTCCRGGANSCSVGIMRESPTAQWDFSQRAKTLQFCFFVFFFMCKLVRSSLPIMTFSPPSCQFNTFHIVGWSPFSPQSGVMRSLLPRLPLDPFGTSTVRRCPAGGSSPTTTLVGKIVAKPLVWRYSRTCMCSPTETQYRSEFLCLNMNKKKPDSSNCVPVVLPTVQRRNDALHRKADLHQIALMETRPLEFLFGFFCFDFRAKFQFKLTCH